MKKILFLMFFLVSIPVSSFAAENPPNNSKIAGVKAGMTLERLLKRFPEKDVRGFREVDGERRITFPYPSAKKLESTVTFYLRDDKLLRWMINDRVEASDEYIDEFIGRGMENTYPKIFNAIRNVLLKLPSEPFLNLTDRQRPALILVNMTSGIARFANSIQFSFDDGEPPAFAQGFYLIRLSDDLEDSTDPIAIEGIVAHEMAHRFLDHLGKKSLSCELEREANHEIQKWGFTEAYSKASELFGAKNKTDSPCWEAKNPQL